MGSKDVLLTLAIATLAMLMHSSVMVTGLEPNFTVTFDVTKQAGNYTNFIRDIHQRLANQSRRYAGGVPMLIPEQTGRNQYIHINLISGNNQITLRLRNGDLYFVSFQVPNGQWYEFQPEQNNPRLFPDTIVLPYTGDYPSSEATSQIVVGPNTLAGAINSLATNFDPSSSTHHQLLLSLIVMIPEAIRFTRVSDFVYARMHDRSIPDSAIGFMMNRLVHEWGALSFEMRQSDLFASFQELDIAGLSISSASQAALALALGLWTSKGPPTGPAFSTNAVTDTVTPQTRNSGLRRDQPRLVLN